MLGAALDRFATGLPDAQQERPTTCCEACSDEIYSYDKVFVVDGRIIHADIECLLNYTGAQRMLAIEAVRRFGK